MSDIRNIFNTYEPFSGLVSIQSSTQTNRNIYDFSSINSVLLPENYLNKIKISVPEITLRPVENIENYFVRSLKLSRREIKNFRSYKLTLDMCEDYTPPDQVLQPDEPDEPFIKKYTYTGYNPVTGKFTQWTSTVLGSKKPDGEVQDFKDVLLVL